MFEIEKLHPKIFVFKSAIKNPLEIIEYYSNKNDWIDWYTFGKMMEVYSNPATFKNFPTKNEWNSVVSTKEDQIRNKYLNLITNLFYQTTDIYFKETGIKKTDLKFEGFNIAKYFPEAGVSKELAMNFHTDYQQERKNIPEYKFNTTCLFYLNDDYDGGEICFKILDKNEEKIENSLKYKPSAGDILVFPSHPPFYHGVKKTIDKEKYIIRTYWKSLQKETDYWKEGIKKHGKENWEKIEIEIMKSKDKGFYIEDENGTHYFQGLK
jgi:hypothetical protein